MTTNGEEKSKEEKSSEEESNEEESNEEESNEEKSNKEESQEESQKEKIVSRCNPELAHRDLTIMASLRLRDKWKVLSPSDRAFRFFIYSGCTQIPSAEHLLAIGIPFSILLNDTCIGKTILQLELRRQ